MSPEELASGTLTVNYETPGHLLNRKVPGDPFTPDAADLISRINHHYETYLRQLQDQPTTASAT